MQESIQIELNMKKLAVLIDADNISALTINDSMKIIKTMGDPIIRRAFGNWSHPSLSSWKNHLETHAITPIHQPDYVTGKNATDITLVIDAMDIIHEKSVNGVCIMSSDSDFTRLALRIREEGLLVYGFGKQMTYKSFVNACSHFFYIDNNQPSMCVNKIDYQLIECIKSAKHTHGWVDLSTIGVMMRKIIPNFNPKNHGFKTLKKLIGASKFFEVKDRDGTCVTRLKKGFS